MDTKNVIAAISLSAAVIIIYGLFFAPSPEQLNQKQLVNEKQKNANLPRQPFLKKYLIFNK